MKLPNGILTVNKPQGMTSRQVVTRVSNLLRKAGHGRQIRVGHCGTLDPMATGLLVICVGKATRLVQLIQEQEKTYVGMFQLGLVTNTDDTTGEVLSQTEVTSESVTANMIGELLADFTGSIAQVPPNFSAVHVNGRRAYKLARQGRDLELPPRIVQINHLELTSCAVPDFELLIRCGSGTYVRSLGRDIGNRLGCGATMKALVRSAIGTFDNRNATAPDQLNEDNISSLVQPPINALVHLPFFTIDEEQKARIYNGRPFEIGTSEDLTAKLKQPGVDGRLILVEAPRQLVAVASFNSAEGIVKPEMVFHDPPRDQ